MRALPVFLFFSLLLPADTLAEALPNDLHFADNEKNRADIEEIRQIEPGATKKRGLDFQRHKLNYFIINKLFDKHSSSEKFLADVSQVKFQISAKVQILEGDLDKFEKKILPLYFAYTQKSFWNVGRPSKPFEENNYNPELFLDYQLDWKLTKRLMLRNVVFSPYEHESNGMAGPDSRSWDRVYIMFLLGLEDEALQRKKSLLIRDKFSIYFKFWRADSYDDQETYLDGAGKEEDFLDYAGRGEMGISFRNLLWKLDNQIDLKTRVLQKAGRESYEIGINQRVRGTNFFVYAQYCYGYMESLQRFDEFNKNLKVGLSFAY